MNKNNFYHLGIGPVKRSTLAYANEHRKEKIYQDLFYTLLNRLHGSRKKHKFKFQNPLYSIDASTIDLCLNLFPWANFREQKAGIKLHVKLDHSSYIPSFVTVTTAKVHEVNEIRKIPVNKGDVLVFDRGYNDFELFSNYCDEGIYFVTRIKKNACYDVLEDHNIDEYPNIDFDKTIKMTGLKTGKACSHKLRIIKSYDPDTEKTIVLLTNNFEWSPETISDIYKDRWQIEVFFKMIKQNLKIKSFFGTSHNAVMTQIWISLIAYLLLKYLADSSENSCSVGTLMAVIPICLFLKKDIWDWLNKPKLCNYLGKYSYGQIGLF
jgi:IS4 transposase